MFTTAFAIILRIGANSFLNAGQKRLSATHSSLETNFKTYFLLFLFCLPLLCVFYRSVLNFEIFFWAVIGGVFGALGNAFLIAALKHGELSVLGPINSYKAIVGLIFGAVLIGEIPSTAAFFGIFLIIFGSYFIFDTTNEGFSLAILKRKDIQFRLLALLFTGIEAVFIKKVIILSSAFCSFLLWAIFGCVFSFIILKTKKTHKKPAIRTNPCIEIKSLKPFLPLAALVFIMQTSTNLVFTRLSVGAALSLFQLSNVLNVFLGYKIFKETNLLKKLTGSIIMILGSVIILMDT